MKSEIYDEEFYKDRDAVTIHSAKTILKIMDDYFKPTSMIDLGGGVGTWAKVGKMMGMEDCKCVDGDYVPKEMIVVDRKDFIEADLSQPFSVKRRFEMAMSLEVAEHLPENCADQFVDSLTSLSDVVLFSAATRGQSGDGHINEQQINYWTKKFVEKGYVVCDIIRPQIYGDEGIPWWYRQNTLVYVRKESEHFKKVENIASECAMNVIMPHLYDYYLDNLDRIYNKWWYKLMTKITFWK